MNTRKIPTSIPALMAFSGRPLSGAQALGVILALAQNTAERILADRIDLVGELGEAPVIRGKEADWQLSRETLKTAQATLRTTKQQAREFWGDAVDLLKHHLGRTWNPAWEAAGFTNRSLATAQGDPEPMLLRIRNYLRDHAAHENAPLNITAAQADTRIAALQAAVHGVDAAKAANKQASADRAASAKRLRQRLTGLRDELDQILPDDDMRWYEFGFSRPIDTKAPAPVTGLIATPGLPGQVLVQHDASARAIDYRVSYTPQVSGATPVVVGLFADLAVTLTGLPSGLAITVSVTARNEAGETQPANVSILVP